MKYSRKYNRKLIQKRKTKKNKRVKRGGNGLKDLASQVLAHRLIKERIPIPQFYIQLLEAGYPENLAEDLVNQIQRSIPHAAASIIAQKERKRPLMTNLLFLKNLIRKRGNRGIYDPDDLSVLCKGYHDLEKEAFETYGNEPSTLFSKIQPHERTHLTSLDLPDLLTYLES